MDLQIDDVYPWGRRLSEYEKMFDLNPEELSCRILDCGGGPASFNAEMNVAGHHVVSCDPLYKFSASEISRRIHGTFEVVVEGARNNAKHFLWSEEIPTADALGAVRMEAMRLFLHDYPAGLQENRYLPYALPHLELADNSFDLALVSHFLFLYSASHGREFHVAAVNELLRVAKEVRIFPLLTMEHQVSEHLAHVSKNLQQAGYSVVVRKVNYEFQIGACEMLVARRGAL